MGVWANYGVFIWFTVWWRNRVNGDTACIIIILMEKSVDESSKRTISQVMQIRGMR